MTNRNPDEIHRKLGLIFVGLIIILLIFTALTHSVESGSIRVAQGNIYEGFFKEPFEVVVFIFKDGEVFAFTNYLEHRVWLPLGVLGEYFEKQNRKIEDIETVIHNHRVPTSFTLSNRRYYHRLKRRGFTGNFKIYYPFSGRVKILEDEK